MSTCAFGYQYPREKKPSNASTSTTMRMIQRMLMRLDASLRMFPIGCVSQGENGEALVCVTQVSGWATEVPQKIP